MLSELVTKTEAERDAALAARDTAAREAGVPTLEERVAALETWRVERGRA